MARVLKVVLGVTFLLVLALGSVPFWAPSLIDWNSQRTRLASLLSEATGVDVAIKGHIQIKSLLPRVKLSISGIEAGTSDSYEGAPVAVGRIDAEVAVWPLLSGTFDVKHLHVEGLRLTYTIDELGRHQWIERQPRASEQSPEVAPFLKDIKVADVQVSNSEFLYDNELTQQTLHATEVNLRAALKSLTQPFELSGDFDLNERPVTLTAALDSPGRLMRGEGARLATTVDSALLQASLDLETWLAPHLGANGSVDVRSTSVGQLAEWLDRPLGQKEDPGELRLAGQVSSTETRTTLEALTLSSAEWDLTISGKVAYDETPTRLSLNIEGDRIDLDRYLPARVESPRRMHLGPPSRPLGDIGLDDPIDLSVFGDFQGEVRIALDGLKVRDFEIGRTTFRASLEDEIVEVELGELGLYGGRLVGQVNLDASDQEPALDAKLAIDRINLDSFHAAHSTESIIGGVFNGAINVLSRGGTPRALITALNGTVLLELDQQKPTTAAHPVISKLNLQLLIPENDENPYLLGRLVYNDKPVTLDIETAPLPTVITERGFPLDASLESDLAKLTYKGDVYHAPIVSFDGNLSAAIPSAGRLAQWLGAELPQDPGAVTLKAAFESDGTQGRISEAYVEGEDLNAEFSGDFDFSGALSKFSLQAKTGVLRLDRYLPQTTEAKSEGQANETSERKTILLLEDISKEPLDLTAFRKLVGRAEIASDGVVLPDTVVGGIAINFHTDQGLAQLEIKRLEVNESVLAGSVQFDGRQSTATADLNLKGTRIDFDTLLRLEAEQGAPSLGKGDVAVTAKASGDNLQGLLRTFASQADATLASVRVNDGHSVETVKLTAHAESLEDSFQVSATGQFRPRGDDPSLAVSLDVTSDPIAKLLENEDFTVHANGRLGDITLEVQAAIDSPLVRPTPVFQFHSAGDGLVVFAPLVDVKLPPVGPYNLAGNVAIEGETAELSALDLSLGKSSVTGQLSLGLAGERPRISGQFAFETLDVTDYYGHGKIDDLEEEDSDAGEPGAKEWIFDDDPLPFELLSVADITDFQVQFGNLKVATDVVFSDVSSSFRVKNERLELSGLRGRLYDGELIGEFSADKSAALPVVKLNLKGTNLDYGVFLKAFDITKRLRGKLDTHFDLNGRGMSLRQIAAGLDGRIDTNARDGEIDRKMLGVLAFGAGSILEPLIGKKDKGKLKCIVSTWQFKDGLGDALVQYYDTSIFAMAGTGQIDLKTETLDLVFNPTAHEISLMKLAVPFRVSGSLESADVDVDSGGTLLEAAKVAGTVALFIVNPAIGLGVLAGQTALDGSSGCEAAYKIQKGETPDGVPGSAEAKNTELPDNGKQQHRR